MLEMAECCGQEQEMSGDQSASDDNSVSLLCNLDAHPSNRAAEDIEIRDLEAQVGNSEQEEEMEIEINQVKAPESGIPCSRPSAAACAPSTSHLDISKPVPALQSVRRKTLKKKALHKRNEKGETLLHRASRRGDAAQVKELIRAGIGVNVVDYAGWTPLHEACSAGSAAVVEELLNAGADVNALVRDVIPLHDAVWGGHYEVVKLLLQHGADRNTRTLGRSALDLTEDKNIRQLLLTCRKCLVVPEESCACGSRSSPLQLQQAGDASSEAQCQSSSAQRNNDTANAESRESDDRDGAREPGDIQLRGKDTSADNLSHSDSVTMALMEIERKQTEISRCLTVPEDAGRYHSDLVQMQDVLTELLTKQQQEKGHLAQKYQSMPKYFRQRLLKKQLQALASRQMTLVKVLQKHRRLVQLYQDMKARAATRSSNHPSSTAETQQPDQVSAPASIPSSKSRETPRTDEDSHKGENTENQGQVPRMLRLLPGRRSSASVRKRGEKRVTWTDRSSSGHLSVTEAGGSSQQKAQMGGCSTETQSSAADSSRSLWELIRRGVLPPLSTVQLLWKGHWRSGTVLPHGSIQVKGGQSYESPEGWLAALEGPSLPGAQSALAWDKVMFRGKPLSHYFLNLEAGGTDAPTSPVGEVGQCEARSSQDERTAAEIALDYIMNVKNIILVEDDEFMPSAVADYYWEKMLKSDSWSDDWDSDFL